MLVPHDADNDPTDGSGFRGGPVAALSAVNDPRPPEITPSGSFPAATRAPRAAARGPNAIALAPAPKHPHTLTQQTNKNSRLTPCKRVNGEVPSSAQRHLGQLDAHDHSHNDSPDRCGYRRSGRRVRARLRSQVAVRKRSSPRLGVRPIKPYSGHIASREGDPNGSPFLLSNRDRETQSMTI